MKERFDVTVSRLQSFAAYIFDINRFAIIKDLFESPNFLAHAKSVCPADQQYLVPFQMNFIVQLPGLSCMCRSVGCIYRDVQGKLSLLTPTRRTFSARRASSFLSGCWSPWCTVDCFKSNLYIRCKWLAISTNGPRRLRAPARLCIIAIRRKVQS